MRVPWRIVTILLRKADSLGPTTESFFTVRREVFRGISLYSGVGVEMEGSLDFIGIILKGGLLDYF